ncbi:sensor histidine kinase [Tessaracoccus sp. OS52]|uniref:sensor histidine kinase n=1 Tax=Tessaracoccus sp. OS52 TaxID=2886691 RepID=UPI001D0FEF72|nr:sensor histidine kinase [Tessaracoccus sp. OS52]
MRDFFGLDDSFVRPVPTDAWRQDSIVAGVLMVLSMTGLLGTASLPDYAQDAKFPWSIIAIAVAGVLITFRRRYPVAVLLLATGVHFLVAGLLLPIVIVQAGMQVLYFLGLYSAVAWARNREALLLAVAAVMLTMATWIAVDLALGVAYFRDEHGTTPVPLVVSQVLINVAYFGGATWLGRNAWLRARSDAELEASQALVAAQTEQLAQQAVVGERLRIARELHDSVAHHVALIGVQAAAARRALEKKPEAAAGALVSVEESARQTVAELRSVLGSLRDAGAPDEGRPSLDMLPTLFDEAATLGLQVHHELVGSPDLADHLTVSQSATLFRVVQEALTNVRTHSTATDARVTVRLKEDLAEVEILDDGVARSGTAGSGLGHIGIRERVLALGGSAEIGPRPGRGYRVRARLPMASGAAQ